MFFFGTCQMFFETKLSRHQGAPAAAEQVLVTAVLTRGFGFSASQKLQVYVSNNNLVMQITLQRFKNRRCKKSWIMICTVLTFA